MSLDERLSFMQELIRTDKLDGDEKDKALMLFITAQDEHRKEKGSLRYVTENYDVLMRERLEQAKDKVYSAYPKLLDIPA